MRTRYVIEFHEDGKSFGIEDDFGMGASFDTSFYDAVKRLCEKYGEVSKKEIEVLIVKPFKNKKFQQELAVLWQMGAEGQTPPHPH